MQPYTYFVPDPKTISGRPDKLDIKVQIDEWICCPLTCHKKKAVRIPIRKTDDFAYCEIFPTCIFSRL